MYLEIERKYLVSGFSTEGLRFKKMKQAYLAKEGCTLRVRIADDKAFLTIKGKTEGFSRAEFEYEIPMEDANAMMELAIYPPVIKTRYFAEVDGKTWEVDVFEGENEGLVMAEIELKSENEEFSMPFSMNMVSLLSDVWESPIASVESTSSVLRWTRLRTPSLPCPAESEIFLELA